MSFARGLKAGAIASVGASIALMRFGFLILTRLA